MSMPTSYTLTQKERLEYCGYRFIHLFRSLYLVRNYSTKAKRFSLYGFAVVRKGE